MSFQTRLRLVRIPIPRSFGPIPRELGPIPEGAHAAA